MGSLIQLCGHLNLHSHHEVTGSGAGFHTTATNTQSAPIRSSWSKLQLHRLIQGRHGDRTTEGKFREAHRDGDVNVVAIAFKDLVLLDMHPDK